ncbi:MAG: ABC transporter ATP-binding protein/permease [Acidimicrobiia bacterium]|nr:ABC transporter ATP-binding protein/permease [Acidimicrobiia bacterium]
MWMVGGVAEEDRLDAAATRRVLRRTAAFLAPQRRDIVLTALNITLYVVTVLAGPFLVSVAIDRALVGRSRSVLAVVVAAYVAVAALNYVLARRAIVAMSRIGETFLRELRVRLFGHLQRQSLAFYDRESSGVLVSRMTSDIDSMQELVQLGLLMLVQNSLLLVLAVVVLTVASWQLAAVCLLAAPPLVWASLRFKAQSNDAYLRVRDQIGSVLSRLQEGIAGVRVTQAYARTDVQSARFAESNERLFDAHLAAVRAQTWYLPAVELTGVATTAAAVGAGGWLVLRGTISVGTVAFFVLTLGNLFEPIQQLSQLFNLVQSAGAALNKVYGMLDVRPDVGEIAGAVDVGSVDVEAGAGAIELDGVGFAYGLAGPPVLSGVSLRIAAGERFVLVGPTGAGKSTVAKLIARLYDPTEGVVRLGGLDLRRATLGSVRRRVVLAPQEGFLFGGSVRENIRLARPEASDAEVEAAVASLGLTARFEALEDGLDTEVRDRGSRLSAGEKQLVTLARVALADPAVLILDEATSSLDPGTEALVEAALDRLSASRTVVVIAHRLSSAERADRVGVVEAGRLIEVGSHAELVAAGGAYAELFRTWMAASSATPAAAPGQALTKPS